MSAVSPFFDHFYPVGLLPRLIARGTVSLIDASVAASVTADFAYDGAEVLTDGNMEGALPGPWTGYSVPADATLSKEIADPHSGTQCMRITKGIADGAGYAQQAAFTANRRYVLRGYLRSDGASIPGIYGGINDWRGVAGAGWQYAECYPNPTVGGSLPKIGGWSVPAGGYTEADTFTAVRVGNVSAVADLIPGGPGVVPKYGAGLWSPGYLPPENTFVFEYDTTYFVTTFTPAVTGTIITWVNLQDYATANDGELIASGAGSGVSQLKTGLRVTPAGVLTARSGGSASDLIHPAAFTRNAWHHVAMTWAGARMQLSLDGVTQVGANGGSPSVWPLWWGCMNAAGSKYRNFHGKSSYLLLSNREWSDGELQAHRFETFRAA